MYKLIVIDLDNTLLNNKQQISPKNLKVIKKVKAKGIEVLIATGRMYISARPYAKSLDLQNEVIVYNGAMVKDVKSEKLKFHKPISKDNAREIIKDLKSKDLHINLYQDDKLYVDQDNDYTRKYEETSGVKAIRIDNLAEMNFEDPTKLLIIEDDRNKHEYYQEYLRDNYGDKVDVTESKHYFIEIGAKGINKGKALQKMAEIKNINREEIIAIGDSYNDIEMLSFAGIGVAMDNSPEAVKEKADLIAPHYENDGVGEILNKLILT